MFFKVPPVKEAGVYEEVVGMRILSDFPFQSLTLMVDQMVYPRNEHFHEYLRCNLIDEQGVIKGDGISYIQYEFPLREIRLQAGDSLRIEIRHNMKREVIPSVTDVGIKLKIKN